MFGTIKINGRNWGSCPSVYTGFENHRKSLILRRIHFEKTKIRKNVNFTTWGHAVLPDMWTLIGQKMVENAKVEKFKWYNLGDFQIAWSILRLVVKSSITRHGNFKRTKSSNKTIWVIFKQRGVAKIIFGIFATTLEHFFVGVYKCNNNKQVFFCLKRPSQSFVNV